MCEGVKLSYLNILSSLRAKSTAPDGGLTRTKPSTKLVLLNGEKTGLISRNILSFDPSSWALPGHLVTSSPDVGELAYLHEPLTTLERSASLQLKKKISL